MKGDLSLEQCLLERRSVRSYRGEPLTIGELGQLLWAAQGITAEGYLRTAPSAGALYPLEVHVLAGKVQGIPGGVYRYRPDRHELVLAKPGDLRRELARAALEQDCIRYAAITILFAAVYSRTTAKYGQRGFRYVYMEAGHAAQNVYLQAAALGLGTVAVGAFRDDEVKGIAQLPEGHEPLYLMPVGRK